MAVKLNQCLLDALEPRRLFTTTMPVAVNFVEEALWDSNFPTAVAQAKALGVTAVRIWFGFDGYDSRPNTWDPKLPFGENTANGVKPAYPILNPISSAMQRAFDLKRAGFKVLAIMNPESKNAPDSPDDVRGLVRHLMDSPETPGGDLKLKDVIDYWEIGNEPDSASYWLPSGANKTTGLKSYVDNYLIPASQELHSDGDDENVVSAGVSYSPNDLNTIIGELKAKNALGTVDYLGFHPYGKYDPANGVDEIKTNTLTAVGYANAVGKKLIATEWSVRGFGNTGANDAKYAAAVDTEYRNVILPNYETAYYFTLVNNWAARGGSTSARPGGLLKHVDAPSVSPTSTVAQLQAYFNTPLGPSEPFYSTFKAWQYGTVSGVVGAQAVPPGASLTSVKVYVDVNDNGTLDAGEPAASPNASGAYTLQYSARDVTAGTYTIRAFGGDAFDASSGGVSVALANLTARTGVNFTVRPAVGYVSTFGSVSGTVFNDPDATSAAVSEGGLTVYLDFNGNGLFDGADLGTVTGAGGAFTLTYDTAVIGLGTAALRVVLPDGTTTTTAAPDVALTAGATLTGQRIGVRGPAVVPSTKGSISGYLFNDVNVNGLFDAGQDGYTGERVVFLDANGNTKLDAGETQATSDANGNYKFNNLSAGNYRVTRVFPSGYRLSNNKAGYLPVTLTAGQNVTGVNVGTTNKTVTTPLPGDPPPVVIPPVVPPATGTALVSGKIFAQASKWNAAAFATPWRVFADANKNGLLDAGEAYTTAALGTSLFTLNGLAAGTYTLAIEAVTGWKVVTPVAKTFTVTLKAGQAKTGQNFVVAKV